FGALVFSERIPSNATEPAEPTLVRLVDLCRRAIAESGVSVVAAGVGCVGPLDQKTGYVIRPVNLPGWKEVALVDTLQTALGIPVYLDNDANAAAPGEHRLRGGRGFRHRV